MDGRDWQSHAIAEDRRLTVATYPNLRVRFEDGVALTGAFRGVPACRLENKGTGTSYEDVRCCAESARRYVGYVCVSGPCAGAAGGTGSHLWDTRRCADEFHRHGRGGQSVGHRVLSGLVDLCRQVCRRRHHGGFGRGRGPVRCGPVQRRWFAGHHLQQYRLSNRELRHVFRSMHRRSDPVRRQSGPRWHIQRLRWGELLDQPVRPRHCPDQREWFDGHHVQRRWQVDAADREHVFGLVRRGGAEGR